MDKSRRHLAPAGGRSSHNSSKASNLKYSSSFLKYESGGTAPGRSRLGGGMGGTRIGGSRRMGGSQSRLSRSGSRKGKGKVDVARIIIKDRLGHQRDVTPKPLSVAKSADGVMAGQAISGSVAGLVLAAGQSDASSRRGTLTGDVSEVESDGGASDSETEGGAPKAAGAALGGKQEEKKEDKSVKVWTKEELHELVRCKIMETKTIKLLHISSVLLNGDDEKVDDVMEKNAAYEQLLESRKEKDRYNDRRTQTVNLTSRSRAVQASPPACEDASSQASTWDIYDTFETINGTPPEFSTDIRLEMKAAPPSSAVTARDSTRSVAGGSAVAASTRSGIGSQATGLGASSSSSSSPSSAPLLTMATPAQVDLDTPAFKRAVAVLEEAVLQNTLHDKQQLYRDIEGARAREAARLAAEERLAKNPHTGAPHEAAEVGSLERKGIREPPNLVPLWSFGDECKLSQGMNVSCLCWNQQNQDLLAAGYGSHDFGNSSAGLVLCWSLKNPRWPCKIIRTKHSVTSLDFSSEFAHLLAVGSYNGGVAIYDVREEGDRPVLEAAHATGKHAEPVWGIQWVTKDAGKGGGQMLCSISSDGTCKQWNMKKGLVPHEMMQLKRIPNKAAFHPATHMEGISREASGLCFDFPASDGTQYYAGTEDGIIHKCSVSYNEQTLENYFGHTGPVYKVRNNPFFHDAFLSCSADWTCCLWSQRNAEKPVLQFQSGHDSVLDIAWSPHNSCVWASVSRDGRVEIWDLESSAIDPVIQHQTLEKSLSCVLFSPNAPVVITGSTEGAIDVYRIQGIEGGDGRFTDEKNAIRLFEVLADHSDNQSI